MTPSSSTDRWTIQRGPVSFIRRELRALRELAQAFAPEGSGIRYRNSGGDQ